MLAVDARENRVSIRKLLYIGESANVQNRAAGHERRQDWNRELLCGEVPCFSAALMIAPVSDRLRTEAAMIHHHKPRCNEKHVRSFPYQQTTISTSGGDEQLSPRFTVCKTPGRSVGALVGGAARW